MKSKLYSGADFMGFFYNLSNLFVKLVKFSRPPDFKVSFAMVIPSYYIDGHTRSNKRVEG